MQKQRCLILIDGSNFYYKLKILKTQKLLEFDFSGFARFLTGKHKIIRCTYYVGAVRPNQSEKAKILHANQQRLFAHLKKHRFSYTLGYLLKSDDRYHEKGVDVNIAVDMLVASYEKRCDRTILVSSDTDLIPAIKKVREKGTIVEYVGFSHQPSVALVANCSESRLLKKEDLLPFLKTK